MTEKIDNEDSGMDKKYELLEDDTIEVDGIKLFRIRALRDFSDVKAGQLGGYIEKESNLSHQGNCWICTTCEVFCGTYVCEDAEVYGHVRMCGGLLAGNASVCGNAPIHVDGFDESWVKENARLVAAGCLTKSN